MPRTLPILRIVTGVLGLLLTQTAMGQGTPRITLQAIEPVEEPTEQVAPPISSPQRPGQPSVAISVPGIVDANGHAVAPTASGAGQQPERSTPAGNASQLLVTAVGRLSQSRTISAKMRYHIHMFEQQLVGEGTYRQLNAVRDTLLRLELKMPVNEQVTSFQQICDGRFLWTRRHAPDLDTGRMQTWVSRIDLHVVRESLRANARPPATVSAASGISLGQGGLPRLMTELQEHFEFQAGMPGEINDFPVITLTGQWKKSSLKLFATDEKPDPQLADIPRHVPHTVSIALGQRDLFPYLIEFRRRPALVAGQTPLVVRPAQPLVSMQFIDVQVNKPIDPAIFDYRPGDSPITDRTQQYLSRKLPRSKKATR